MRGPTRVEAASRTSSRSSVAQIVRRQDLEALRTSYGELPELLRPAPA